MAELLYSTNPFFKYWVQKTYRKDLHWMWCSPCFDPTKLGTYVPGALIPPSSSPLELYKSLEAAVKRGDMHDYKVAQQKTSVKTLAQEWLTKGEITSDERDDIFYFTDSAPLHHWRPLIYVIPRVAVQARLISVPASKRAGLGEEFTISQLQQPEFDVIEV